MNDNTEDERANVELRLKLILAHAKLRGWIVDRRQVSRSTLDLGKLLEGDVRSAGRAQLMELFEQHLNQLQPGARARLRAIAAGADLPESNSNSGTNLKRTGRSRASERA